MDENGMDDVLGDLERVAELAWSALIGIGQVENGLAAAASRLLRTLDSDRDHLLRNAHRELSPKHTTEAQGHIRTARKALQDYGVSVAPNRFSSLSDLDDVTKTEHSSYVLIQKHRDKPPTVTWVCDAQGTYQETGYVAPNATSDVVVTNPQPSDLHGDKLTVAAIIAGVVISTLIQRLRGDKR
ncbi:hypothetical protein HPO96_18505 [Kribbella sandramycini]|uniref:Uncharacterized protein n=1 Tax=Kribbella sandramycini TaxID=60450 RepID=A0A7Y4L2Y2_9ACTN|nr:hypothetical protein [Kribbella sandramycini]MBB6564537.1 hypothetical protein [Kribbella sandramycini]NOL42241.1 hypothetical protein [Kribbella sandramycini]